MDGPKYVQLLLCIYTGERLSSSLKCVVPTAQGPTSLHVSDIVNTSLPGATRLEAVELGDVPRLDGKVVLPGVLGREVLGAQDLGGPGVPDGGVREGLAPLDGDARAAVVVEHDGRHLGRAVDAIRLAGDAQGV